MNNVLNTLNKHASIGADLDVLTNIHEQDVNIAIFQRDVAKLKEDIERLLSTEFEFRFSGEMNDLLIQLKEKKELWGCEKFLNDIAYMLQIFEHISGAKSFRLLLATINHNMCSRFHTDNNDLRLLCTYSGPGTLWLAQEEGKLDIRKIDESHIQHAKAGEVVILKGSKFPGNPQAIIHRSPTIEESGLRRLLLRVDTN
jgi:hypothetical protein